MELLGFPVVLNDKSIVGYALQAWLGYWMDANGIRHTSPTNSQEPPDYWLHDGETKHILEVKTFNLDAGGAAFDIANFEAYLDLLANHPEHLRGDYLIMGYRLKDGALTIEKIWLKKIWEITSGMQGFPLKVQRKRKQIYNIRPSSWESNRATYPSFDSEMSFLASLFLACSMTRSQEEAEAWKAAVTR